jgi:hypothetical protein
VAKDNSKMVLTLAGIAGGMWVLSEAMGGIKGLLEKLGLKDDQNTKDLDQAAGSLSFWSPTFYKSGPAGTALLTSAAAEEKAHIIWDAFGGFDDNEDQAIGVFKTLRTQSQASFLAEKFYQLYQQDLLTFLRGGSWPKDRLSDADVNVINSYVNSLPKYK